MWIQKYKLQIVALLSIFLLGGLVYWKALSLSFLADDYIWLVEARGTELAEIGNYYVVADGFFYRPNTKLYFWLVHTIFGVNASAFHTLNLLIHISNAIFVYLIARRIFSSDSEQLKTLKSWMVAAIFLVHPVHIEPTVWVSGVTELLPATGILLSMLLVLKREVESKILKIGNSLGLSLLYFLAVGAHEYAILFPVVLFLWQVFQDAQPDFWGSSMKVLKKEGSLYFMLGIVGVVYLSLRFYANSHWQGGDYSYDLVVLPINLVANAVAYVFLAIIGPETYEHYLALRGYMRANLGVVALIALIVAAMAFFFRSKFLKYLKHKKFLCGSGIYLSVLLAFLPLGNIAERYVYIASIWVYVSLVILGERALKSQSKDGWAMITLILTIIIGTLSYMLAGDGLRQDWRWQLAWGVLLSVNAVVIYKIMTSTKLARQILLACSLSIVGWGLVTYVYIVRDWHVASAEVNAFVGYFSYACDDYVYGDSVAINVNSKVRTAWVFPVGHEQAVELVCNKKISIIRL